MRNTNEDLLKLAESKIAEFLVKIASSEGVKITTKELARFEPVVFDDRVIAAVDNFKNRMLSESDKTVKTDKFKESLQRVKYVYIKKKDFQ